MISPKALSDVDQQTVDAFQRLYYDMSVFEPGSGTGDEATSPVLRWFGVPVSKCPLDLWIYQEIIYEKRPQLIIETGTYYGGSALFLADVLDLIGEGHIATVDVKVCTPQSHHERVRVEHPRIEYVLGSSTSPEIVERLKSIAAEVERVMVILDSDHSMEHVLDELSIYSDLVTDGQYLVVEDTCVNGHPLFEAHGPGPMEALERFFNEDDRFVIDKGREKLLMTFQPNGYLLKERVAEAEPVEDFWKLTSIMSMSLEDLNEQLRRKDAELDKAADYAGKLLSEIEAKNAEMERMAAYIRDLEGQFEGGS